LLTSLGRRQPHRGLSCREAAFFVDRAFIYEGSIDRQTYEKESSRLSEELAVVQINRGDAQDSEDETEALIEYAKNLLGNVATMWREFGIDEKQRLQKLIFPKGISYRDGKFGTAPTAFIFKILSKNKKQKKGLVAPTGIEPVP
jgi:hypothetical protein